MPSTGATVAYTSRTILASRLRLKELELFKGKTLKRAREFIRLLELVFALAPDSYLSNKAKVLYSIMFLVGEARKL